MHRERLEELVVEEDVSSGADSAACAFGDTASETLSQDGGAKLTKAQRRVLRDLNGGGWMEAALRRSSDFSRDGVLFSESVGVLVKPPTDPKIKDGYLVRDKTAQPLYSRGFITHELPCGGEHGGGLRPYYITPAGRAALSTEAPKPADSRLASQRLARAEPIPTHQDGEGMP